MNTRSKRASSVALLLPFLLAPIAPDGTLDQGDRQHGAHTYSGILAGPAVPEAVANPRFYVIVQGVGRTVDVGAVGRTIIV